MQSQGMTDPLRDAGVCETVAVDGAELVTWRTGSGPPVVLLHGGPGLWHYLAPVASIKKANGVAKTW